ncbi:hypothetical protein NAP1_14753 [Erythrobacter sp. NAP1]|uniref:transglycosylase SLT domain-containing protein n=1 Tax=Erythrobacter sp. NAP1 TaxID=237727 RepID=UPI000068776F|nr:transglycosylase SLT domain-containing protein [Erythrobacter sp. NAP1]EAQ28868.1 hypothetical protein NAP1_14753 [Erythrobacter sp. NAP1]
MNPQSVPSSAIRSAFEQAARVHHGAHPQQGATRQIAAQAALEASTPARPSVEEAIANAAQATSVDFDFLVAQAQVESAMNPTARARTSSATGLYQFIESTWLGTMQRHGARFGLGNIAAQIDTTPGGTAYVADPNARQAILAMRNDPEVASLMAAGLAEDNRSHLAPILGRQPDHGELYLAHFLGAGGAGRFLSEMAQDPNQSAAALFRRPAAANQPVFFERNGAPRSLAGVMDYLSAKLERARSDVPASPPPAYAAASLTPPDSIRPPYMIADEAVFGPRTPPTLTGQDRPTIASSSTLALAAPSSRAPISDMLDSQESAAKLGSEAHAKQVRRAYDQLKALGL